MFSPFARTQTCRGGTLRRCVRVRWNRLCVELPVWNMHVSFWGCMKREVPLPTPPAITIPCLMDTALIRREEVWRQVQEESVARRESHQCLSTVLTLMELLWIKMRGFTKKSHHHDRVVFYKQWDMRLFRKWQKHDKSKTSKRVADGCGAWRCECIFGEIPFAHQRNEPNTKPRLIHCCWQH